MSCTAVPGRSCPVVARRIPRAPATALVLGLVEGGRCLERTEPASAFPGDGGTLFELPGITTVGRCGLALTVGCATSPGREEDEAPGDSAEPDVTPP